jgi:hypothetical protein
MSDVQQLASQILSLFKDALQHVHSKFSHEDQQNLEKYAQGIADRTLRLRSTQGEPERRKLQQEIAGFSGAISLMIDRYLLQLNHELERALLKGLETTAAWLVKIVVSAVV